MQVLCSDKDHECFLEPALSSMEPVILSIAPFVGSLSLRLHCHLSSYTQGLCYSFQDSRITYISNDKQIPLGTYLAVFRSERDYLILLCLSHQDLTVALSKESTLHLTSGHSREANKTRPALIAYKGQDIETMLPRLLSFSLAQTGQIGKLLKDKPELPLCFGKLGWHSRFMHEEEISHHTILTAVRSVIEEGFPIGFVLLEEGWQQLDPHGDEPTALYHFEADRKRFPLGLKGLIQQLKDLGVEIIGVWHGMMGYKGGIHTRLAQTYDFPPDSQGRYFPGYDLGRTFQFFYDYYAYLKEQGIAFVKVGDQESTSLYCRKGMDVTRLYKNLQTAIQGASSLHFQSAQFNADCLRSENLFYWTNSLVASCRKNDLEKTLSTPAVIRHCLTHALWLKHLMHPDFEAWSTSDASSETSAIFHALSGSFNMICDSPGKHNSDLLRKSILPSGKILKADCPLTLCKASLFIDPLQELQIYKAYTMKGANGVMALFHLADKKKTLKGVASPQEIPLLGEGPFAVFSARRGFMGLVEKTAALSLKLKNGQSDVLTFAPVKKGIGVIGCYLFFLASAPIVDVAIEEDSMHISSSLCSPLLVYCERQVLEIRRGGQVIPWTLDNKRRLLSIDPRASITEIASYYTISFE